MISANLTNAIRKSIYRRDGFRCAICDSTRGLQIHHIIHRSQGGAAAHPHNLITLCWRCHAIAHGTRFADCPDYMDAVEMVQSCIEYVADMYAGDWYPYEGGW